MGDLRPAAVEQSEEGVVIRDAAWQRLWEKSALGWPVGDALLLAPEEVVFCHDHRERPWPSDDWLRLTIADDPSLLQRAEVLAALRAPGNLVVLRDTAIRSKPELRHSATSWAVRWHREKHPSRDEAAAEVRWAAAEDSIDWPALDEWSQEVESAGRIAEFLVVDEEFAVVTYRLRRAEPRGDGTALSRLQQMTKQNILTGLSNALPTTSGVWLPPEFESAGERIIWPVPHIGIPLHDGRMLSDAEVAALQLLLEPDAGSQAVQRSENRADRETAVLADLFERGCAVRSGFKYGTRWRAYAGAIGEAHAPWLVQTADAAPTDWAGACLVARLAAGVNKTWCVALPTGDGMVHLAIDRPPSDARWSNPQRR